MRKSVVFFVIMSLILGTGYLVALGSPPDPGWINYVHDGIDSDTIGTLEFHTFVSANYRKDGGIGDDLNEYYSYHWAKVEGNAGTKFKIEFRHSPFFADPPDDVRDVRPSGVYEYSSMHATANVAPGTVMRPYTSLRPVKVNLGGGGGSGDVTSRVSITIP